jgi:hypothetical protein
MIEYYEIAITVIINMIEVGFIFYFIEPKVRSKFSMVVVYIVMASSLIIMAVINVNVVLKILFFGVISVIILLKTCHTSIRKLVFELGLCVLVILIGEILSAIIFTLASQNYSMGAISREEWIRTEAIICAKISTLFILLIFKKICKKSGRKISVYDFIIICIPILSSIIILFVLGFMLYYSESVAIDNIEIILIIFIAIILSSLCSIMISEHYLKVKEEEYRDKIRIFKMRSQYHYYKDRQEDEKKVQKIYHDLKNHLLILKTELISNAEVEEYIDAIMCEIKSYENYINTQNKFLDIIVSEKIRMAREKNIELEAVINYEKMEHMEPMDICALFGNAIDNAIEATTKMKMKEERLIKVKARRINGNMVIKFENYFNSKLIFSGDRLLTTKSNQKIHGFGTENIRNVVKKYKGNLKIITTDNKFVLIVKLPFEKYVSN